MTKIIEARVKANFRYPSVRAFGGRDYDKDTWVVVPEGAVEQLPHQHLDTRERKMVKAKPHETDGIKQVADAIKAAEAPEVVETPEEGSLEEFFGAKIAKSLRDNEISDVGVVMAMSDKDLVALPGIGKRTLKKIRKATS